MLLHEFLSLEVKGFISNFGTKFVPKFDIMRRKVKGTWKEAANAKARIRMFSCSIYFFIPSLKQKILIRARNRGKHWGFKDEKNNLFLAFTKANWEVQKITQGYNTGLHVTLHEAHREKPKYVKESFQNLKKNALKETLKLNKTSLWKLCGWRVGWEGWGISPVCR